MRWEERRGTAAGALFSLPFLCLIYLRVLLLLNERKLFVSPMASGLLVTHERRCIWSWRGWCLVLALPGSGSLSLISTPVEWG